VHAAGGYGHRQPLTKVDAAAVALALTASERHCHSWGDGDVLTAVTAADVDEGGVISSPQRVVVAIHTSRIAHHHRRLEAAAGRWCAMTRQNVKHCHVVFSQGEGG
jgi:hypothetical protein